jgi:DNA-binding LacI/PurR family transcriptional regulator
MHAGVSKVAASRVLDGSSQVDPDTRERVLGAIAELEYTPSDAARRLSFGRTLTINVVSSSRTRPQAAERLRGVEAALGESEFDLVIHNVETVDKLGAQMLIAEALSRSSALPSFVLAPELVARGPTSPHKEVRTLP